jgi:3-oxoacyl-(acyl-carrier-protein) synthase
MTGHTLGAAIEDVVMVKALQKRKAPPIANLTSIPDHFKALNFSNRVPSHGFRPVRKYTGPE